MVLSQLCAASGREASSTPPTSPSVLMAAEQLLQLSAPEQKVKAEGVEEAESKMEEVGMKEPPFSMNGFVGAHSLKNSRVGCGLVNGNTPGPPAVALCSVDEDGEGGVESMETSVEGAKKERMEINSSGTERLEDKPCTEPAHGLNNLLCPPPPPPSSPPPPPPLHSPKQEHKASSSMEWEEELSEWES